MLLIVYHIFIILIGSIELEYIQFCVFFRYRDMVPRKILSAKRPTGLAKSLEYQRKQQLYKDFYNLQKKFQRKEESNKNDFNEDETLKKKYNSKSDYDDDDDHDSEDDNITDINDLHINKNHETLKQNLKLLQRFITTQIKINEIDIQSLQLTKDEIFHEFPHMAPILLNGIFETLSIKKPPRLFVLIHRRKTTSRYILNIAKIFQMHQFEYVPLESLSFTKLISTQQQQCQYDHSSVIFIHIMLVYLLYALFCNRRKIFGVIECENIFAGQQLRKQIQIHYPMLSQIIENYTYFM